MFKEGRESMEDEPRPTNLQNRRNEKRWYDRRYPGNRSNKIIGEDLGMRVIYAKLCPQSVSKDLFWCIEEDPEFLDNVITGNETWIFEHDREIKRQNNEWHIPQSP